MAASNKFATFLHRNNTPKIVVVLIYTLLEWALIALLLLDGLFSYSIAAFAEFFGLDPPCFLCSHALGGRGPAATYRRSLCDPHAREVAGLGFCRRHRNVARASRMCEDCARSEEEEEQEGEEEEEGVGCSCCSVVLGRSLFDEKLLHKSLQMLTLGEESGEKLLLDENYQGEKSIADDRSEERWLLDEESQEEFLIEGIIDGDSMRLLVVEDASMELLHPQMHPEVEERLVPVALVDSSTLLAVELLDSSTLLSKENDSENILEEEEEEEEGGGGGGGDVEINTSPLVVFEGVDSQETLEFGEYQGTSPLVVVEEGLDSPKTQEFDADQGSSALVAVEDGVGSREALEFGEFQGTSPFVIVEDGVDSQKTQQFGEFQAASEEENGKVMDVEANYEISIGSEICDQDEPIDLPHLNQAPPVLHPCSESQPPLAFVQCLESYEETTEKRGVSELTVLEAEPVDETLARVAHRKLSVCPELISEVEEERAPETPTSVDSFNVMHKRFREFGTESLDGSVASEIDGNELLTVDHLKAALKSERKALSALYSELEEERSASSIAANQTMAMITRLQEEKAAMQMEAFQYQRMMEEQSEYDQEALQLLNDLVMKREREKQELEEELEAYREKVFAYEAKERRSVAAVTNGRSQTSSALSTGDESNDLSSESHDGDDCDYNQNESHQNTPVSDALSFATDHEAAKHLLTLDDSLADFEEERFSILEQLKALEEKLLSLDDDNNDNSKMGKLLSLDDDNNGLGHHFPDENGHGANGDYESCGDNVNGLVNDSDTNGKLHDKPRSAPASGKSLLPLFDATVSVESEDGLSMNQDAMDGSPDSLSKSTLHNHKKLAIAEEVDNIYERLQALEGDREFIKHCISSMRKGDKGMDLLQEILQHLRDLRSVQLRVRNAGYALASISA